MNRRLELTYFFPFRIKIQAITRTTITTNAPIIRVLFIGESPQRAIERTGRLYNATPIKAMIFSILIRRKACR